MTENEGSAAVLEGGAAVDEGLDLYTGGGDEGGGDSSATAVEEHPAGDQVAENQDGKPPEGDKGDESGKEEGLQEYERSTSARLRGLTKEAPELNQVLNKYPKVKGVLEAIFRREEALREVFPQINEARQIREQFPNGMADVQQFLTDQKEVEALDNLFYQGGADGSYPGHAEMLKNFHSDDPRATAALLKTAVREWPKLDRESYGEVMGQVVAATFKQRGIPEFIDGLMAAARQAEVPELEAEIKKLGDWVRSFGATRKEPTEEERKLSSDRQQFERERAQRDQEDGRTFQRSFVAEARKVQAAAINAHPAIKRLVANTAIPDSKKAKIVEEIRTRVEKLLSNSPSFMRKLRPAHAQRNLEETVKVQKAAWAQPWLMNRMVRAVLAEEVPAMTQQSRDAAQRRQGNQGGSQQRKPATDQGRSNKPTGPRQVGGRWYRQDGTPFTTQEVLSGKHLQA